MKKNAVLLGLTALSAVLLLVGLYLAMLGAPEPANIEEPVVKHSFRIIFFHVPTAWVGFLAFFVTFLAGTAYLRTQARKWDIVALASAEIGTVFILGVLITGSIWAKPSWNTWWTWEWKLTISLVQFLVYLGYLTLRGSVEDPARRARFAAVYGTIAFLTVPMNVAAVFLWGGGSHPKDIRLGPNMTFAFVFCLVAFTLWYATLMWHRFRLERLRHGVEQLKRRGLQ